MTTVSQIITDGFREANLIRLGATPTTNEQTEALARLQNLVTGVLGFEAGQKLVPCPVGQNNVQYPQFFDLTQWGYNWIPSNLRLMCNLTEATTLNLPPNPQDGERMGVVDVSGNFATYNLTLVGNGSQIEGATQVVMNTNGYTAEWFYRADTGDWALVSPLSLAGDMPYPADFDDLFIISLAARLAPRNGRPLAAESAAILDRQIDQFAARYGVSLPSSADPAVTRMATQAFGNGIATETAYSTPTAAFNTGWPFPGRRF